MKNNQKETEKETFTFITKEQAIKKAESASGKEIIKPKKITYSISIPLDKYIFLNSLVSKKVKAGQYNYALKDAFLEGLEKLKEENPNITSEALDRRYYRGGGQKSKVESFRTSSIILVDDKNWIDNFIAESRKTDEFFSKTDFIIELVKTLEK